VCLLSAAHAATPDAQGIDIRPLAATCAACHGTDGEAVRGAAMPRLAGLPSGYFVLQMEAFRTGARSGTVMQQIAKGFSAAQTEALANYFAAR
jgi:cytochrome c553